MNLANQCPTHGIFLIQSRQEIIFTPFFLKIVTALFKNNAHQMNKKTKGNKKCREINFFLN